MKVLMIGIEDQVVNDMTFCLRVRYPEIEVITSEDGQSGLEILESDTSDIVILGSSIADMKIKEMISNVRESNDTVLIVLSDGHSEVRLAEYLEAGADDCITAKFSPIEFLARIAALLRRIQGTSFKPERIVAIGGDRLSVNLSTREVLCSGKSIHLTPTEFGLLCELIKNAGKILPQQVLTERLRGPDYEIDQTFIKKYIHRLRSKIENEPTKPQLIINERGMGYKLVKNV